SDFIPATERNGVQVVPVVRTGVVGHELVQIVKDQQVRLVVMGTHGRRNLGRWVLGSVTECLLRQVPVPLLTVSHVDVRRDLRGHVPLKRILYATDLSESTDKGLQTAAALAHGTGAHLTVMHAVYYPDRRLWAPQTETFEDERRECLVEIGKKVAQVFPANAGGLCIDSIVVEGTPFQEILEVTAE